MGQGPAEARARGYQDKPGQGDQHSDRHGQVQGGGASARAGHLTRVRASLSRRDPRDTKGEDVPNVDLDFVITRVLSSMSYHPFRR